MCGILSPCGASDSQSLFLGKRSNFFIVEIDFCPARFKPFAGGVVEPWAGELSRAWKRALDSLGGRKLVVDLTDVT